MGSLIYTKYKSVTNLSSCKETAEYLLSTTADQCMQIFLKWFLSVTNDLFLLVAKNCICSNWMPQITSLASKMLKLPLSLILQVIARICACFLQGTMRKALLLDSLPGLVFLHVYCQCGNKLSFSAWAVHLPWRGPWMWNAHQLSFHPAPAAISLPRLC